MAALDISSASAIDASVFNSTKEEAYDDLRALKIAATTKVQEVVRLFNDLKDLPDEGMESLATSQRKDDYNMARSEVIEELQSWYVKTGEVVRQKPGTRPEMKVRAAHRFMRQVKSFLRGTTPLGGEEEVEADRTWLAEVREAFPAPAEGLQRGLKDRLRSAGSGVLEALSPKRQPEKMRTSTPEDIGKRRKLEERGGGGEEVEKTEGLEKMEGKGE